MISSKHANENSTTNSIIELQVCQLVDEDLAIEEKTKDALLAEYNDSLAKEAIENR